MRRFVWAWPVGLVGNVLLFTVFATGGSFSGAVAEPLWGQAGRQVFFAAVVAFWLVALDADQQRRRCFRRRCHRAALGHLVRTCPASWPSRSSATALAYAPAPADRLVGPDYRGVDPEPARCSRRTAWRAGGSSSGSCWLLVDIVGVRSLIQAEFLPDGRHVRRLRRRSSCWASSCGGVPAARSTRSLRPPTSLKWRCPHECTVWIRLSRRSRTSPPARRSCRRRRGPRERRRHHLRREQGDAGTDGVQVRHSSGYLRADARRMLDRLEIPLMTPHNRDNLRTAYTISVDARDGSDRDLGRRPGPEVPRLADSATEPLDSRGRDTSCRCGPRRRRARAPWSHRSSRRPDPARRSHTCRRPRRGHPRRRHHEARPPALREFADEHGLAMISIEGPGPATAAVMSGTSCGRPRPGCRPSTASSRRTAIEIHHRRQRARGAGLRRRVRRRAGADPGGTVDCLDR